MPGDLSSAIAVGGLALLRAVDLKERERRHTGRKRLHHHQRARDGGGVPGKEVPRRVADEGDLAPGSDDLDRTARARPLRPPHAGTITVQHEVETEAPMVPVKMADGVAPSYRWGIHPPKGQRHVLAHDVVEAVQISAGQMYPAHPRCQVLDRRDLELPGSRLSQHDSSLS